MSRLLKKLHRPSRRTLAKLLVALGGASFALGASLVYLPVGVMLAGAALVAFALLIFDVE